MAIITQDYGSVGGGGSRTPQKYEQQVNTSATLLSNSGVPIKASDIIQLYVTAKSNLSCVANVYFIDGVIDTSTKKEEYIEITVGADGYVYAKNTYNSSNHIVAYI